MRTIDLKTTQNVVIQYELASVMDRLLAFILDVLILFLGYYFLIIILSFLIKLRMNELGILLGLAPIFLLMLYHFFSEVLAGGQSLGKKAMGIKVVRLDGEEASLSDYLLRAVFLIIDVIFSIGFIAILMISATKKHQRLGDLTANTTVIKIKSLTTFQLDRIISLGTTENYEPEYPGVRVFTEKDMLLVKQTLTRFRTYNNDAHRKAVNELAGRLASQLQLERAPRDNVKFLKTVLQDYIVLTR